MNHIFKTVKALIFPPLKLKNKWFQGPVKPWLLNTLTFSVQSLAAGLTRSVTLHIIHQSFLCCQNCSFIIMSITFHIHCELDMNLWWEQLSKTESTTVNIFCLWGFFFFFFAKSCFCCEELCLPAGAASWLSVVHSRTHRHLLLSALTEILRQCVVHRDGFSLCRWIFILFC